MVVTLITYVRSASFLYCKVAFSPFIISDCFVGRYFEIIWNLFLFPVSPVSVSTQLIFLAWIDYFCDVCKMVIFRLHYSFWYLLSFYCEEELSLLSVYLFLLFFYPMWTNGLLFYSVIYSLLLSFILLLKLCKIWLVGPLHSSFYVFLTCRRYSLNISVFYGTLRCSRLIISLPQPRYWLFLQKVLVPFSGEWVVFRNQDPRTRCVHCLWSITATRLFRRWS